MYKKIKGFTNLPPELTNYFADEPAGLVVHYVTGSIKGLWAVIPTKTGNPWRKLSWAGMRGYYTTKQLIKEGKVFHKNQLTNKKGTQ